jgi:hypothetical protein
MFIIEEISVKGGSGEKYPLSMYSIDDEIPSNLEGVYIFAKRETGMITGEVIYIGQGNVKKQTETIINKGCVVEKGATHIFVFENEDEQLRIKQETDILLGSPECYEPTGCNIKNKY